MARVLYLLLIFAAFFNISTCEIIVKDDYIIGGNKSAPGDAPYQVSIRILDMSHICGGSIIDKRWILTAAHCLHNINPVYIVAGSNQLSTGGTRYDVLLSIKHMWYDPTNQANDIGLIKTTISIVYTSLVQPVYLPWRNVVSGEILTLTGWGITQIGNPLPNDLQIANVRTISNLECAARLAGESIYFSNVCTYTGLGACFGDSGGPMVANGYIHALVSWGIKNCSKIYPEVNVRVFHYNLWIILTQLFNVWR